MTRGLLLLWVLSAAPAPAPAPARAVTPLDAPTQLPLIPLGHHPAAGETKCSACHVTASWKEVRFNHDKTGFPLRGEHSSVDCRSCHVTDFTVPIARQCVACHFDAHAGDLGSRCEGCHDESSWRTAFDPDAHRLTDFPLIGAHGVMPCEECHGQARERRFARATVECSSCHQADLMRTFGTAVDHTVFQFTQPCQTCHNPLSFKPARFPAHDTCFRISRGSHAAYTCEQCHSSLPRGLTPGTCSTGTASCSSCHDHKCGSAKVLSDHKNVQGFVCADLKCAQCHPEERGP